MTRLFVTLLLANLLVPVVASAIIDCELDFENNKEICCELFDDPECHGEEDEDFGPDDYYEASIYCSGSSDAILSLEEDETKDALFLDLEWD
ncbi:MAG: hypothetical protein KDD42_02910, partial [Bdellovibrionales bacterium]|nr:hypothetical protein [Bdellovibrionales bacterium]